MTTERGGPPTKMTEEVKSEILDRIAGGESLVSICEDEHMPTRQAVYRYMRRTDEDGMRFRASFEVAMVDRLFALAEETIAIADDASGDWEIRKKEDGSEYVSYNPDSVARARLRVETRQWFLERLRPHVYGRATRLNADVGGGVVVLQPKIFQITEEKVTPKVAPGMHDERRIERRVDVVDIDPDEI